MYNTKFCKVAYLSTENAIFCQWKHYCEGDDYRNPFLYGLEMIEKYKAHTWITDTTDGFENDPADTQWLVEVYMPKLIDSSLKKIVFVIKEDSPLMDEIQGQVESLRQFFEVELVDPLNNKIRFNYLLNS